MIGDSLPKAVNQFRRRHLSDVEKDDPTVAIVWEKAP
jgi:hypothetical protein